jgi:hypothetical protein
VIRHVQSGKTLTYREIKGKDVKVLGQYKGDSERTYALMGKLCGPGEDAIMSLKKEDRDAAVALSVPFSRRFRSYRRNGCLRGAPPALP